mgnify:CR=1 FL=1
MNNRIVVLGSCSVCHMFYAQELPARGETLIGNDYQIVVGGKGSGQAVVAQKLGGDIYILEHLGDDAYGRSEKASYEEMGIHTDFVHLDPDTPTGSAGIYLNSEGQNAIIVVPCANSNVSRSDVDEMREVLRGAKLLGAQLEIPAATVDYAIRMAAEMGVRTMLDPAPVTELPDGLFPCISIIKPNECEAASLTGIPVTDVDSAIRAAHILLNKGVREGVIVTLGEKGAVLVTCEKEEHFPGIPVTAVDTGGAGDTFAGALLAALSRDWNLEKSIRYAQCASAICVTRKSSYSMTRQDEVDALFAEHFSD